ncbi:MAG TPA: endolytic transglycosylase MltG [Candidatus Paceibacterota bacterium]
MGKKTKISLGVLVLVCALSFGVWAFASRSPREFTTTLDLKNKQILADPPETTLADTLSDFADLASNMAGSLLAAADSDYIHIREGLRKEEIADLFGKNLDWSKEQKLAFATAIEGKYYPGTYSIPSSGDEDILREVMLHRFEKQVAARYSTTTARVIKLDVALKVASLIEREAGGKNDMRLISGVIWNRIFKDMPLGIDATLQYAKATSSPWWPKVLSVDKDIDSRFNTYIYKGLPPTPIASPGLASIDAALNPKRTDCLYYLHDSARRIHCAVSYASHLKNIKKYLQ